VARTGLYIPEVLAGIGVRVSRPPRYQNGAELVAPGLPILRRRGSTPLSSTSQILYISRQPFGSTISSTYGIGGMPSIRLSVALKRSSSLRTLKRNSNSDR
jgi:hypothetical protein